MRVPIHYNVRSLFYRKSATAMTVLAIGLTVAVLIILLSVQQGFQTSVAGTGRADNIVCVRKASTAEASSNISRDDYSRILGTPGIAKNSDGQPLASAEMFAGVTLPRLGGGGITNVSIRGVQLASFDVRGAKVLDGGRRFRPGVREVVVGKALTRRISGCTIGGTIRIGKDDWPVVGIHDSGGAAFDSEIWADVESVMQAFDAPWFSTVVVRCADGMPVGVPAVWEGSEMTAAGSGVIGGITERVGTVTAKSERLYFEEQAGMVGATLTALAVVLTTLMGFGALAGCTNTLLAAVAGRTREIGGLLAIGYRPWQIFVGFLFEAVLLSLLGAAFGILCTLPLSGLETGTTNWKTFTEQAFQFEINGTVIGVAMLLALAVGLLGGVFPAWRASRLRPVDALRRG